MNKRVYYKVLVAIIAIFIFSENGFSQGNYVKTGMASFYADKFEGRQTSNGEIYYHAKRTAAHRTLPFGSIVKVTNLENNKYVVVRINDRGPFIDNRLIDLSKSAANELGFIDKGLVEVRVELIASTDDLPDKQIQNNETSLKEYYKVDVDAVSLTGKGVQIGSYENDENVFRLVEEIKNKYNEEVFVEVAQIKKHKVYRIIVGNYSSDAKLEALKKVLSMDYPGCFIVTFKN